MTLAERSKRRVMLTPVGKDLVRRARIVLNDVADIEAMARAVAGIGKGDLRLGAIPTVGPFLVPRALPMLRATWPHLWLFLREELTELLLEGLAEGRLDLIIIALPHDIGTIETELLSKDGYQLATPVGHSLAGRTDVTGELLAGASLLLLEKGHCLQRHALEAYAGMPKPARRCLRRHQPANALVDGGRGPGHHPSAAACNRRWHGARTFGRPDALATGLSSAGCPVLAAHFAPRRAFPPDWRSSSHCECQP